MAEGDVTPASGVATPADWSGDVLLTDGRSVHLRWITPSDRDALRAFHESLSDRTVYLRFFTPKRSLSDADLDYFTGVDHHDRVALVAIDDGVLVGVCRFDALGDGSAEVAFVIRDDIQGRGLGSLLLEHLAEVARQCGIERFRAEVLPDNMAMLATFRASGYDIKQRRDMDVVVVDFAVGTAP